VPAQKRVALGHIEHGLPLYEEKAESTKRTHDRERRDERRNLEPRNKQGGDAAGGDARGERGTPSRGHRAPPRAKRLRHQRADDTAERDHRPDGKIDPAANDYEGHADRRDAVDRGLVEHEQKGIHGKKRFDALAAREELERSAFERERDQQVAVGEEERARGITRRLQGAVPWRAA